MSNLWDLVYNGDNITLWCTRQSISSRKRVQQDVDTEDICLSKKQKKLSKMEEMKVELHALSFV